MRQLASADPPPSRGRTARTRFGLDEPEAGDFALEHLCHLDQSMEAIWMTGWPALLMGLAGSNKSLA
jgi:hypothetical protein